jgi:hypothetical protein
VKKVLSDRQTWPSLKITFQLLPWHWKIRPRFYADDVEGWLGYTTIEWLFVELHWGANRPMFTWPRQVEE